MFIHFPCIRTLFSIYFDIFELLGTFLIVSLSFPLFSFMLVVSMAPKRKSTPSQNPLRSGHPLPLILLHHIFGSVIRMPVRRS